MQIPKNICASYLEIGIPEAIDQNKLQSDLEAQGYAMPTPSMFRDRNGRAITNPLEQNLKDAQFQVDECAQANGGPVQITILRANTSDAAVAYGNLVKAQLDALHFKNCTGIVIQ